MSGQAIVNALEGKVEQDITVSTKSIDKIFTRLDSLEKRLSGLLKSVDVEEIQGFKKLVNAQNQVLNELRENIQNLFDGFNQIFKSQQYLVDLFAVAAENSVEPDRKEEVKKDSPKPSRNGVFNPKG